MARQRQVPVARQLLVCTLLNERNQTPAPSLVPSAGWIHDNDYPGWAAMSSEQVGRPLVSPVARPARRPGYARLPSTYVEVSDQDIFCDESLAYAQRLAQAGVPLELHVWPSAPHAFDLLSPATTLGQLAWQRRVRMIRSL